MNIYPHLTEVGMGLVNGLVHHGPPRWMIQTPEGSDATANAVLRKVFVAYLCEQDAKKRDGLVIGPSGNMHLWHQAGWRGRHLSSVKFMDGIAGDQWGAAVFDLQEEHSDRYVCQLSNLLDVSAAQAVFWLPAVPRPELIATLTRHRFTNLDLKT